MERLPVVPVQVVGPGSERVVVLVGSMGGDAGDGVGGGGGDVLLECLV